MWSDILLAAEHAHLVRLALWGGASIVVGSLMIATLAVRRARSPLLRHFAIQIAAWGVVDLVMMLARWRVLALRDLAGATRLDRFVWFSTGLDLGLVVVGVTLAITGWMLGRRLGVVGAGIGVVVQGLALAVLDLALAAQIGRVA